MSLAPSASYPRQKTRPFIDPGTLSPQQTLFEQRESPINFNHRVSMGGRQSPRMFIQSPLRVHSRPGSSLSSQQGQESFISTCSLRKPKYILGLITGETSKHFLVKRDSAWIPILKTAFFNEKGENLPSLRLKVVRNKKVKIFNHTTYHPEAHIIDESDALNDSLFSQDYETVQDSETETGLSEEDGNRALEAQVALTTELFTDIVALASLAPDQQRSQKYTQQQSARLKKTLDAAFSALRTVDPDLFTSLRPTCKQLISNLDSLTTDYATACGNCKIAQSHVSLSCGHLLCIDCSQDLVQYTSGTEFKLERCPLCQRELTITDARLILLEKYEALKKGMKYVEAIGLEFSTLKK